ncbi:MAG: hypothetical protein QXK76_02785 [Candidatus Woesearchaeota archaeon]
MDIGFKNKKSERNNNKAQVTIFVLLGLVILIAIAIFFYSKKSLLYVKPPVDNIEVTDEIKPIQLFVLNCLKENSKEALIKIGQNGGYINVSRMKVSPIPYDSDALVFEPQIMPYWYYVRPCRESSIGCVDSLKPPLCDEKDYCVINSKGPYSIEEQLSKYIESEIGKCLNFKDFEDLFEIKKGKLNVNTIILDNAVEFQLKYPLEIISKSSGKKAKIEYFVERHNLRLKDIYILATDITQTEIDTNFLELQTMNLISIYSGLDKNKLPPLSNIQLSTNIITWTKTSVKEVLMNDVLPFMSFIRFMGTNNDWQIMSTDTSDYSIYADGIYHSMEYNINNKTYDLKANVIYPYSDIYLDFGGSEILKPREFNPEYPLMKAIGMFIKEYKFKYDISYPLIVSISDPYAFNGEGYTFNYALEVNIRKNVPVKGNISVVNIGGTGSIRLDSETQKVNRLITVKTINKMTKEPLEGVRIYYRCGDQYLIGETYLKNNEAVLTEKYPFCELGGQIVYEKEGFMGSAIDYDNKEGDDAKEFMLELWPIVEKKIMVYKRTPLNVQAIQTGRLSALNSQLTPLSENETVFISITREKSNPYEQDVPLVGFLTISGEKYIQVNTVNEQKALINKLYSEGKITKTVRDELLAELSQLNDTKTIESLDIIDLVPGRYVLDAFMIYNGNITIPKEIRKICVGVEINILGTKICTNPKDIELPEQKFNNWMNGGAKINFTLTQNDVYGKKDKIIIYVLEQPIPYNWRMLEAYKSIEEYQKGKEYLLKPKME